MRKGEADEEEDEQLKEEEEEEDDSIELLLFRARWLLLLHGGLTVALLLFSCFVVALSIFLYLFGFRRW